MVPRLNIGGAETYTKLVAENLQKRGYNVHIASGGGLLANKLAQKGIKNSWLPMRFSTDISAYLLKYIVKKYNIDLIHANSAAAGITAMKYKQRYNENMPVVFTAHGKFSTFEKENIIKGCNKIIYVSHFVKNDAIRNGFKENNACVIVFTAHGKFSTFEKENIIKGCNKIIYVSHFVKNDAIRNGFKENNACVIYTGIDINKFDKSIDNKHIIRERYNIKQDDFVMAIVARIKNLRNKGHQDLLEMMNKYTNARNWHLLVIGKGKGMFKLKSLIKKYKLENNVHCIGHVDNVEDFVRLSDVVVLPSDFETFGLALAEGMAMGKAGVAYNIGGIPEIIKDRENGFLVKYKVLPSDFETFGLALAEGMAMGKAGVAYNIGGIPEIIKDRENGFLVKYKDIEDLYDKLSLLANDRLLCKSLGTKAYNDIKNNLSVEKMMDKIEDIYNSVR